jgi:hypothetical protein
MSCSSPNNSIYKDTFDYPEHIQGAVIQRLYHSSKRDTDKAQQKEYLQTTQNINTAHIEETDSTADFTAQDKYKLHIATNTLKRNFSNYRNELKKEQQTSTHITEQLPPTINTIITSTNHHIVEEDIHMNEDNTYTTHTPVSAEQLGELLATFLKN